MSAKVRAMGYVGNEPLKDVTPALHDEGISLALGNCEKLRGDLDTAVSAFGIERAMFLDNKMPVSAENSWRLAIRDLCPANLETF